MQEDNILYSIGDEILSRNETIEEAVDEYVDNFGAYYGTFDQLPLAIEVQKWRKAEIKEEFFNYWIDNLLDNLDGEYRYEDYITKYTLSDKAKDHLSDFITQVISEFPVEVYDPHGVVVVNPHNYLITGA